MSKKQKKKFYAIKEGNGVSNIIVDTWTKCSELVLGYNSVYKSFPTREDAENYLGSVDAKNVKEQAKKGMEAKKVQKAITKTLHIKIPKEMYEDFEKKCTSMDMSMDKVIENMIMEWLF